MYYFDRSTGIATPIGPTDQDRIADIWYDAASGEVYAVSNSVHFPEKVYRIDTVTGATTELFNITCFLLGLGKPTEIPSPTVNTTWGSIKAYIPQMAALISGHFLDPPRPLNNRFDRRDEGSRGV
jgi:hypothetical protein